MTQLAALLDVYPDLPPDQRAEVDARVAGRPELAEAHAEARRLAALLDAATAPVDADDVARVAVDRRMGRVTPDAAAVAAARAEDPGLEAEADAIEARLDALETGAEDPVARFERLRGGALEGAGPVGDRRGASARGPLGLAASRPPVRRVGLVRWAVAAVALVVAYGGLFVGSRAAVPERARVAALGEVEASAPPTLRGSRDVPHAQRLVAALDAVEDARRSVLGLFPSYDAAALDAAAADLAAVAADVDPASWASQEARLALGRVHLYRGRDVEAARTLESVVAGGGYRAPEARRLLDYLRSGA